MANQIMDIATRIRELRNIENISIETLAPQISFSAEDIRSYESGTVDIPISFLLALSNRFDIELAALLTGGDPHLQLYTLTRAGKGRGVNRREGYRYQSLAFNMANKMSEPFLVTADPVPEGTPVAANTHDGQEFDYVLEGTLRVVIDGKELILNPGDSLYYNSAIPHGMQAVGDKPSKFLAIVM